MFYKILIASLLILNFKKLNTVENFKLAKRDLLSNEEGLLPMTSWCYINIKSSNLRLALSSNLTSHRYGRSTGNQFNNPSI